MNGRLRVAESVTPGHVDRVADAIAERLVEEASNRYSEARCGFEVAVNAAEVVLQGYVLTLPPVDDPNFGRGHEVIDFASLDDLSRVVNEAIVEAGYVGPHHRPTPVRSHLLVDDIEDDEQLATGVSTDQVIAVGHATAVDDHDNLPIEAHTAREVQRSLLKLGLSYPELLGPDGKVLVGLRVGEEFSVVEFVNVSIQHRIGLDFGDLYDLLAGPVTDSLGGVNGLTVPDGFSARDFVINGRGEFTQGGALGDTGLSGKKLVADLYGPAIPIGGGAISGKDQWSVDRIGTLRARHLAVRIAAVTGMTATVTLTWFPGEAQPRGVQAELSDGRLLDAADVLSLTGVIDLSIASAVDELLVCRPTWPCIQHRGYVGVGERWDRP